MKTTILLVGDYNRSDFLFVAKQLHGEVKFYFIEYLNKKKLVNKEAFEYGDVLFWKDFTDAYNLLEKIKPDKVLFYFIESYNHVALNVASRIMCIPTYHLEHGLRFPLSFFKAITKSLPSPENKRLQRLRKFKQPFAILDKIQNRRFFFNTVKRTKGEAGFFLKEYFNIRSKHSIIETWQKLQNPLRLPDSYISYSPFVFKFHQEVDMLPEEYPVRFIGMPGFDHFVKWKCLEPQNENILFIDQPFHERSALGWTKEYKIFFLRKLAETISEQGKILYFKPHPYNSYDVYEEIAAKPDIIFCSDQWESIIPDIDIVLGFSSTLLLPFMAMDNVCCFTLELHPEQLDLPYSHFLLATGACNVINDFEDLSLKIRERKFWHNKQKKFKESFIKDWLYKFDGKSTERLRKILIGDEAA